jgi:hypothetical protein
LPEREARRVKNKVFCRFAQMGTHLWNSMDAICGANRGVLTQRRTPRENATVSSGLYYFIEMAL